MADEATVEYYLQDEVIPLPVDETANIAKGTLLRLKAGKVVAMGTSDDKNFVGIAMNEKKSGDGRTVISVAKPVIGEYATTAAAVASGAYVVTGGAANKVKALAANTALTSDNIGTIVGQAIGSVGGSGGRLRVIRRVI